MKTNIYRQKLLNAVLYFAGNTKFAGITKMSKLLYFLDFMHFKETGYPSIGLQYFAFDQGPVPKSFWLEVKDGNVPEDFKNKLAIIPKAEESESNYKEFKAKASPDLSVFTPREKKILENIVFMFSELKAKDISDISHLKKEPWDITRKQKGKNGIIDYVLALDDKALVSKEEAEESLKEHFEIVKNFSLEPSK